MKTKITKRIFAVLLTVVMLLSAVPVSVFAANGQTSGGMETETYAKGVNSVGNVLAETIEEAQTEAEEKATANAGISKLDFESLTANVKFTTDRDSKLVVAVYTEDGKQMLASAVSDVEPEDIEATVELEDTTLPQYYLVKAFLLDSSTNAALCDSFSNDTHTKAYIDFMSLDINDFDEEKVINLDENEDTNFLVVTEEASIINGNSAKNNLKSADYEKAEYVFENVDDKIKNLETGDIFYYEIGENFELIKVKSIKINGTTATIIADDMEIEEAFEFVKIDSSEFEEETPSMKKAPARSKGTSVSESVQFFKGSFSIDLKEKENGDIGFVVTKTLEKGLEKDDETDEEKDWNEDDLKFVASATADVTLNAVIKVFINNKYKNVEFTIDGSAGITLKAGIEFSKSITLGKFEATFIKIVNVGVKISFKFEFKVTLEISGTITFKKGIKWSNDGGFEKIDEKPSFKPEVKVQGEFYIGFEIKPYLSVIHENIVSLEFPLNIGARITAWMSTEDTFDKDHDCLACIAGDIKIEFTASADLWLAKKAWLFEEKHYSLGEFEVNWKITDFYYSITHNQFGWGKCLYRKKLIEFGSYPQSEVTDSATLYELNSLISSYSWENDWNSYGYYSGAGTFGTMQKSDYMKYIDLIYKGKKFRAVKFISYRPFYTFYVSNSSNTSQDENGFYTNTVYWFEYEPIKWRIIDSESGYIMSELLIDSQSYSNTMYSSNGGFNDQACTIYSNDYVTSSIREWLNNDFYFTAFNGKEMSYIINTSLDNQCTYTSSDYDIYDSHSTNDDIFLPSYFDMTNTDYGFSSNNIKGGALIAKGSDYAKCQGLLADDSELYHDTSSWRLRSPGIYEDGASGVSCDGTINDFYFGVNETNTGIRPALYLKLTSFISKAPAMLKKTAAPKATRAMTAADPNFEFTYSYCIAGNDYVLLNVTNYGDDFELTDESLQFIDQLTADENGTVTADFEPKEKLNNSTTLLVGDFGNGVEARVMTKCNHENTAVEEVAATCTTDGYKKIYCTECDEVLSDEVLPATNNHADNDHNGRCDSCDRDNTQGCDCRCHKDGFAGFIYKIVRIFWKLFRTRQICDCGISHY